MKKILTSKNLPAPRFRYSPCVKAGPFYQTAGMVALDPASGGVVPGGPGAETRHILANLVRALPDFDLSLEDLVSAVIYTTDMKAFADINAAWEETFTPGIDPPARTAVGVVALPLGASVEIEFRLYREGT